MELDKTELDIIELEKRELDCIELDNSELDRRELDNTELDRSELDNRELESNKLERSELDISELDCNENAFGIMPSREDDLPKISGHAQLKQSRVSHLIRPRPSHTRSQNGHESGQGSHPGQVIHMRS